MGSRQRRKRKQSFFCSRVVDKFDVCLLKILARGINEAQRVYAPPQFLRFEYPFALVSCVWVKGEYLVTADQRGKILYFYVYRSGSLVARITHCTNRTFVLNDVLHV